MNQPTFVDLEYEGKKRKTRQERFLKMMGGLIPWKEWEGRLRPFYPKGGRGHRPRQEWRLAGQPAQDFQDLVEKDGNAGNGDAGLPHGGFQSGDVALEFGLDLGKVYLGGKLGIRAADG